MFVSLVNAKVDDFIASISSDLYGTNFLGARISNRVYVMCTAPKTKKGKHPKRNKVLAINISSRELKWSLV